MMKTIFQKASVIGFFASMLFGLGHCGGLFEDNDLAPKCDPKACLESKVGGICDGDVCRKATLNEGVTNAKQCASGTARKARDTDLRLEGFTHICTDKPVGRK